jgi:hypothetical protein
MSYWKKLSHTLPFLCSGAGFLGLAPGLCVPMWLWLPALDLAGDREGPDFCGCRVGPEGTWSSLVPVWLGRGVSGLQVEASLRSPEQVLAHIESVVVLLKPVRNVGGAARLGFSQVTGSVGRGWTCTSCRSIGAWGRVCVFA